MIAQPLSQPHLRGALLILCGALLISVQDATIKLHRAEMTLWQIFALRGVLVVSVLLAYAAAKRDLLSVVARAFGLWPLLRSVFITTTFLCFYAALPFLSLATVGAANYTAPIFITLLSAFVLRKPVGALGWIAVFIGFAGVFVLLRPGSDAFSLWTVLPLTGAVFYALTHIVTSTKCAQMSLLVLVLSQSFVMMMAGLIVSLVLILYPAPHTLVTSTPYIFGAWSVMSPMNWLVMVALVVLSIALTVCLAGAYQVAPPVMIR